MLRRHVLLLLVLLLFVNTDGAKTAKKYASSLFSNLRTIIHTTVDLYRLLQRIETHPDDVGLILNEVIDWLVDDEGHELPSLNAKLADISSDLDWMKKQMETGFAALEVMISQQRLTHDIERMKGNIALRIRKIKDFYDVAVTTSLNTSRYNTKELQNTADTLTGKQAGDLQDSLLTLYDYIVPEIALNLKKGFLDLLNHHVQQKGDTLCGDIQSPNQYLYHFHELVVTTEMMGQVASTFGYYLQHKLNNGSFDFGRKQAQKEQHKRLTKYFGKFKTSMTVASLSVRPCDPSNLIRDTTFFEMEKLYQAVLVEDYKLNYEDSCRGTCDTIDVKNYRNDVDGVLCARLHKCWSLSTSRYCIQPTELRRYQWIEDQNGMVYGEKNGCQGTNVTSAGRWKSFYECETCICTCQGHHELQAQSQVQAFSLRVSRSNTAKNMVVTGIKFSRIESIICVQIKQGRLLPSGEIEKNSEEWIDCDVAYSEGRDYVVLSPDYNYIDLDDVIEQTNLIVTGVKFALSDSCKKAKHVKLELEYTKFNFSSGELNGFPEKRSSSRCHTERISIADTDSPLNQRKPRVQNTVDSRRNSYVSFGFSSFRKDVGQTTLPLLDAQPVESKPSAPLSGAGLFYKAAPGYGGFLAFKIHTLNYGTYMDATISKDIVDENLDDNEIGLMPEGYSGGTDVNVREKVLPALDGKPSDDTAHLIYEQSRETDYLTPSYSPYFTFLIVPILFGLPLCIIIIYNKWQFRKLHVPLLCIADEAKEFA